MAPIMIQVVAVVVADDDAVVMLTHTPFIIDMSQSRESGMGCGMTHPHAHHG